MLQEQDALPSPSNSESDLPSSEDEKIVGNQHQLSPSTLLQKSTLQPQNQARGAGRMRIAPPPPPNRNNQSKPV